MSLLQSPPDASSGNVWAHSPWEAQAGAPPDRRESQSTSASGPGGLRECVMEGPRH